MNADHKRREYHKAWRAAHMEQLRVNSRRYYRTHPEYRKRARHRAKMWVLAHRQEKASYMSRWYRKNKWRWWGYNLKYLSKHPFSSMFDIGGMVSLDAPIYDESYKPVCLHDCLSLIDGLTPRDMLMAKEDFCGHDSAREDTCLGDR